MNKEKQKVNYMPSISDFIVNGGCAYVYALNHPRLGEMHVRTSTVQSHDRDTGIFETVNTIYTPEPEIKQSTSKPHFCHKHG